MQAPRDEYDLLRSLPWDFLELSRAQAERNHDQTLEHLRQRR